MTAPTVVDTRTELAEVLGNVRNRHGRVGLVPTMGALHEGHASLMQVARGQDVEAVVVSIFVNPAQFAPHEDLEAYPRTFEADLEMCAAEGVDVVFAPSVSEVYSGRWASADSTAREGAGARPGPWVTIDPGPLGSILEGASRPTHFSGVLTVVAKLFGIVRPDVAVFGEKDYQQLLLVRRMVHDLSMPVHIVGAATVREADGLALSSRNRYLDPGQRRVARSLSGALHAGVKAAAAGADAARGAARARLAAEPGIEVDYLALTSPDLGPAPDRGEARLLVAARVGSTRLIDNTALHLGEP